MLLCLPPVMLAVERGNNDLVIFMLLAITLSLRKLTGLLPLALGYGLIEACAMLKLYQTIVLGLALRERRHWGFVIVVSCGLLFAVYLFLICVQVKEIHAVVPHPFTCAFGRNVFADRYDRSHPGAIPHALPFVAVLGILAAICFGSWRAPMLPPLGRVALASLLIGGLLHVSAFSLNANYNYRLVFLLFAVPALLELTRMEGIYQKPVLGLLLVLGLSYALSDEMVYSLFTIKEVANWVVFVGVGFLLLQSDLPSMNT